MAENAVGKYYFSCWFLKDLFVRQHDPGMGFLYGREHSDYFGYCFGRAVEAMQQQHYRPPPMPQLQPMPHPVSPQPNKKYHSPPQY